VNAYLAAGGRARGVKAGASYFDVGTLAGYRTAMSILDDHRNEDEPAGARPRHAGSDTAHSDLRRLEAGP
jgi:hypothetical protein